jgi:hypothetical protein
MFRERVEIDRPGEFERLSRMTSAELDAEEARLVNEIIEDHRKRARCSRLSRGCPSRNWETASCSGCARTGATLPLMGMAALVTISHGVETIPTMGQHDGLSYALDSIEDETDR